MEKVEVFFKLGVFFILFGVRRSFVVFLLVLWNLLALCLAGGTIYFIKLTNISPWHFNGAQ